MEKRKRRVLFKFGETLGNEAELSASFAKLVKKARRDSAMSITRFAGEAGVSPNSLISAESGTLVKDILSLKKEGCSPRKAIGVSRTTARIVARSDGDPEWWCEQLGLAYRPDYLPRSTVKERLLDISITLEQVENLVLIVKSTAAKSIRLQLAIELLGLQGKSPP